jgi:PIN domain nuclease of toxin-antitoxin system
MNFLLDTHSFLWFIQGNSSLSITARNLIQDPINQPYISTASLWEIAIKVSIGKLNLNQSFETLFPHQIKINGIELLEIDISHIKTIISLPFHHRDPFDRMLAAQAQVENIPLVSADQIFDKYSVSRIW